MAKKYVVELRHRASADEPYEERHRRIVETMSTFEAPWGLKGADLPGVGDIPPGSLSCVVRLPSLSKHGSRSYINYALRSEEYLKDQAQFDDFLILEFTEYPGEAKHLFDTVFPAYALSFDCYRGAIADRDMLRSDWSQVAELRNSTGRDIDGRDSVYRIHPVNFWDRELCQRAFRLQPEQVAKALSGKLEEVSLLGDGVLVVTNREMPEASECLATDRAVRSLLTSSQ